MLISSPGASLQISLVMGVQCGVYVMAMSPAPLKFSMLCCLQFLKSTLQHESDLVSIHGRHFEKS